MEPTKLVVSLRKLLSYHITNSKTKVVKDESKFKVNNKVNEIMKWIRFKKCVKSERSIRNLKLHLCVKK